MGEVIPIGSQQTAEEAWEAYAAQARRLADDSRLIADRSFMQELWRRERVVKRLLGKLDA